MGIFLIPHTLYVFHSLKSDLGLYGKISFFFLMIACIGIPFVGIISTDLSYTVHIIAAAMAFGGIGLGMIFLFSPLKKRIQRGAEWPTWNILFILFIPLIIISLLTIIIIGIPAMHGLIKGEGLNAPEIWAFFEWLLVFSMLYWFAGIVFSCKPE